MFFSPWDGHIHTYEYGYRCCGAGIDVGGGNGRFRNRLTTVTTVDAFTWFVRANTNWERSDEPMHVENDLYMGVKYGDKTLSQHGGSRG